MQSLRWQIVSPGVSLERGEVRRGEFSKAKLAGTLRRESRISTRNQMLSKKIEGAWRSAA